MPTPAGLPGFPLAKYRERPMAPVTRLITGSGRLLTPDPYDGPLPWAIATGDGRVTWIGPRSDAPPADDVLDVGPALVTPALVDAHTHPVYAGDRSDEAAARLAGESYSGGGVRRWGMGLLHAAGRRRNTAGEVGDVHPRSARGRHDPVESASLVCSGVGAIP